MTGVRGKYRHSLYVALVTCVMCRPRPYTASVRNLLCLSFDYYLWTHHKIVKRSFQILDQESKELNARVFKINMVREFGEDSNPNH